MFENDQDWILDIQMHKKLVEQKAGSKDAAAVNQTALMYANFRHLSKRQMKMDAKFDAFALQMNIKFELMSKILESNTSNDHSEEELAILSRSKTTMRRMSMACSRSNTSAATVLADWKKEIGSVMEESALALAEKVEEDASKVVAGVAADDLQDLALSQRAREFDIQSDVRLVHCNF